ncbi:MAG: biopolymer transport protein ExbD [Cryomorphaceae bacterium]|jgi:biopolymer transport protein ExbD
MASNKLRALNAQEEKEDEMDMSPMIDMVFLLLIFFIVVSTPLVVKVDPEVRPAIAFNSTKPLDKNGRIVLNIRGEKDYRKSSFKEEDGGKMETEDEIAEYIEDEVTRIAAMNSEYIPKLHLRGDKEVLFEFSQIAVSAAAKAGVNQIVFSVYPFSGK